MTHHNSEHDFRALDRWGIPDVRDGLTRVERAVLKCLYDLQGEEKERTIPVILLWGELVDRGYDLSQDQLTAILQRLTGKGLWK